MLLEVERRAKPAKAMHGWVSEGNGVQAHVSLLMIGDTHGDGPWDQRGPWRLVLCSWVTTSALSLCLLRGLVTKDCWAWPRSEKERFPGPGGLACGEGSYVGHPGNRPIKRTWWSTAAVSVQIPVCVWTPR